MSQTREYSGLAEWERRYDMAERSFRAEWELLGETGRTRKKPVFHWVMAVVYLAAFLGVPALSIVTVGDRWGAGDWAVCALVMFIGVVNLGISGWLAGQERDADKRDKLMDGFESQLEELWDDYRGPAVSRCEDPALLRFWSAFRDAHGLRVRCSELCTDALIRRRNSYPICGVFVLAGLLPVITAGVFSGGWDLFEWIVNPLMTGAACILAALELLMLGVSRAGARERRLKREYLDTLRLAHENYLNEKKEEETTR